ncbi:MAG: Fic family protein [Syntrophaceae bacterium]|nr:Fic family protein [Syntrophaceae bacterium]
MQLTDFKKNRNSIVVKTPQNYIAFVPNELPPEIELSWDLVTQNSNADRALSELSGITKTLPNPHLLIGPFIKREAVLSSRIEGTRASLSDLFFFEASGEPKYNINDVKEVSNYVRALEYGLRRQEEFPMSLRLIREIHAQLMEGVRGEAQAPGEFRRSQNWIGLPGCTLMDTSYVPPPVAEMNECLSKFESFLHSKSNLPLLIRLAMIHYQFEAIHPFLDGNGRIGRLLITLLLCSAKVIPGPVLYLSAYFEKHRDEYYGNLLNVSLAGRWNQWIVYFLRAIEMQSREAVQRSHRLLAIQTTYRARVQTARTSALVPRLIDFLLFSPVLTVPFLAKHFRITQRAAQLNIDKLTANGILKEVTGQQRNRMYVAKEIVSILEGNDTD